MAVLSCIHNFVCRWCHSRPPLPSSYLQVVYAAFRFVVHRLTSYIDARTEQELEEADVEASENGQTSDELHDESSGESVQGEQAGALPPSPPNLSRVKSVRRSVTEVVYEYYEPV